VKNQRLTSKIFHTNRTKTMQYSGKEESLELGNTYKWRDKRQEKQDKDKQKLVS